LEKGSENRGTKQKTKQIYSQDGEKREKKRGFSGLVATYLDSFSNNVVTFNCLQKSKICS
jgi:hypothetical protein